MADRGFEILVVAGRGRRTRRGTGAEHLAALRAELRTLDDLSSTFGTEHQRAPVCEPRRPDRGYANPQAPAGMIDERAPQSSAASSHFCDRLCGDRRSYLQTFAVVSPTCR
jgi:hypothetical protein